MRCFGFAVSLKSIYNGEGQNEIGGVRVSEMKRAQMIDFHRNGSGRYRFSIGAEDPEAIKVAVDALRLAIAPDERWWDEERGVWEVVATPENEVALCEIFVNGERCLRVARGQLRLL